MAGVRRNGRAVSLDKCFRATVRMYVLLVDPPPGPRVSSGPAKGPTVRAARISQFDFRSERSLIAASSLRGETKAPRHDALESRFLNWIASAVHIRSPTKRCGLFFIPGVFCKLSFTRRDDLTVDSGLWIRVIICYILLPPRNPQKNINLGRS